MKSIDPYLHFMGNTEDAMNFYKSVFGGEFIALQRFKDVPGSEKMGAASQDKIIHASLPAGKLNTIMATDTLDSMEPLVSGNNFHLCVHTDSEAETDKIFNALSKGGKIEMPLNKTFWGAYFGMCVDKYGIPWMISFNESENQRK
jgi:PhnB protein